MAIRFSDSYIRTAYQTLHFDLYDKELFCGKPYMCISEWKHRNWVYAGVHDDDDFDVGIVYKCNSEEEMNAVFHELINYLYDLRNTLVDYRMIQSFEIFPDLGVEREWWC